MDLMSLSQLPFISHNRKLQILIKSFNIINEMNFQISIINDASKNDNIINTPKYLH